jgi:hypothetical protein
MCMRRLKQRAKVAIVAALLLLGDAICDALNMERDE